MADVDIEYEGISFEENPQIITWVQLFFLQLLNFIPNKTEFIQKLTFEWDCNSKIDIYKYFFDEELLHSKEKEKWMLEFLELALLKMESMSLNEFSVFISDKISSKVEYQRML